MGSTLHQQASVARTSPGEGRLRQEAKSQGEIPKEPTEMRRVIGIALDLHCRVLATETKGAMGPPICHRVQGSGRSGSSAVSSRHKVVRQDE